MHAGRTIDVAPQRAAAGRGRRAVLVDGHAAQRAEVDHNRIVDAAVSGRGVAAAANRHRLVRGAGVTEHGRHIARGAHADQRRRAAIDRAIPDCAGRIVFGVGAVDNDRPIDVVCQTIQKQIHAPSTRSS